MDTPQEQSSIPTQKQRWVKYGLNVGVLLLAVLLILFIINFIAYQKRERLDFTHNRRYTLSPQTLRVLKSLDQKVAITTFYRENSVHREKLAEVDRLLAEYNHRGDEIDVRHIDPAVEIAQYEKFTQELLGRFSQEIEQRKATVKEVKALLERLRGFSVEQGTALTELLLALPGADQRVAASIQALDQFFRRASDDLTRVEKEIDKQFSGAMPDFEQVRPLIQQPLETFSRGALTPAVDFFSQLINRDTTPDAAKEKLLGLRDRYRELNESVEKTLEELGKVEFGRYEEVRSQLERQNCVVVMVDAAAKSQPTEGEEVDHRGVAVLSIEDLYPEYVTTAQAAGGQRPEQTYKGEEAITGALLRLTLEHKTRVVFVNPSPQPVLMGRAQQGYGVVAQRLRAMNFTVEEWQPGGAQMFGRPSPPQPRPEPKPGETLVFIVLPPPPPNPQMPINPAADLAGEAIKEHLAAGRPALVMSMPSSPFMVTPASGSVLEPLKELGIEVEPGKMVVVPLPGRERGAHNVFEMSAASSDHPITKAVLGLPGIFAYAQPVKLEKKEGVESWPLVRSPNNSWADPEAFPPSEAMRTLTHDAGEADGPITVAAAAKKGDQRVVVVADPIWATDDITSVAAVAMGASMAELSLYARFPGNAELFVNSIYWLAGMDDLIAPGAKAQETRRLAEIGDTALSAYRWLLGLGLPAACLVAGVAVWFVRRR